LWVIPEVCLCFDERKFGITHNDTHTRPLVPSQALPNRHTRQLDRVIHIHINLLVSLVFFCIQPKVGKRRLKQTSTDTVCIWYVVPLLLARVKDLVEVRPVRYVCLHIEDVVFASGECVKIRRSLEIGNEDFCA
jgi:hypothetical protein